MNISKQCSVSASSYINAYFPTYLNSGITGVQTAGNYWNNQTGQLPAWIRIDIPKASLLKLASSIAPDPKITEFNIKPIITSGATITLNNISIAIIRDGNIETIISSGNTLISTASESTNANISVNLSIYDLVVAVKVYFNSGDSNANAFCGGIEVWQGKPKTVLGAVDWLVAKSYNCIFNSKRIMVGNIVAYPPQVSSGYDGFWLRDYVYMLETCANQFPQTDLDASARLFVNARNVSNACVDTIKFDGTVYYNPGYGTMGSNPVADGSQFTVGAVYYAWKNANETALYSAWKFANEGATYPAWKTANESVLIKPNQLIIDLADKLALVMNACPISNNLFFIDPALAWDRCPYGFMDSVKQTGGVLFPSLLYVQACQQLAEIFLALNRPTDASTWTAKKVAMIASIVANLWSPASNLYLAATVKCNQPDIWGSAFAVYLGIDETKNVAIANALVANYSGIVAYGHVRHLLGGTFWQDSTASQGTYQNGGYWPTATGWLAYTIDLVNPTLANQLILDLLNWFIRNGTVAEWINVAGVSGGVNQYTSSATLPIAGITAMIKRRTK